MFECYQFRIDVDEGKGDACLIISQDRKHQDVPDEVVIPYDQLPLLISMLQKVAAHVDVGE